MTKNLKLYLNTFQELLVARLRAKLSEEEEVDFADKLEYYWRQLTQEEEQEANRIHDVGSSLHFRSLVGTVDAPVASFGDMPPRKAC